MKHIFLLTLTCCFSTLYSQDKDYINTDRPDQSEGIYTLAKRSFQTENGFTFSEGVFVDDLMLRYGLFNGTELRLSSDFVKLNGQDLKISVFSASFKQEILKENDVIPAVTFVGYITYQDALKKWSADMCLAFENNLSERFSLAYNVGLSKSFSQLNTTFQGQYSLTNRLFAFAEYFAFFTNETPSHNLDCGILYCLSTNFQIDTAFGRSIFRDDTDWFVSFGISYRFF
ncbi:transporter [Capnocytophaga sp.]|uniref:transporter n=1 Tax=Capnocytophaga sp. TaxID=44737 RepID=UPI0026DAB644|nr:transporter [Capnocytophaga sp.]MDO5106305.1 transporter [Capnocytophaga sp.]